MEGSRTIDPQVLSETLSNPDALHNSLDHLMSSSWESSYSSLPNETCRCEGHSLGRVYSFILN